jgi:uncharacterized protein YhjY with autotransporter beta-barrel domain
MTGGGVIAGSDPQSVVRLLSNSAWSELSASQSNLTHQQNTLLGNTKNSAVSLRAGTLIAARKNASVGVFISENNNLIEQETYNRAIVNSFEGGFYGGLFSPNSEYKAHLSLGQHNFSTRRNVDLLTDYKNYATFSATSIKFGAQASYINRSVKTFDIKPFAGFRSTILMSDEINEKGADLTNLKVAAQTYKSLTTFAGLQIQNDNQDFSWHAKVEAGYLMAGNGGDSQYEMSFTNGQSKEVMRIRGLEIDPVSFSFGAGIEMPVLDNVNVYADAQFEKSLNISFVQANVGIKIMFNPNKILVRQQNEKRKLRAAKQAEELKVKKTLAKKKPQPKQKPTKRNVRKPTTRRTSTP